MARFRAGCGLAQQPAFYAAIWVPRTWSSADATGHWRRYSEHTTSGRAARRSLLRATASSCLEAPRGCDSGRARWAAESRAAVAQLCASSCVARLPGAAAWLDARACAWWHSTRPGCPLCDDRACSCAGWEASSAPRQRAWRDIGVVVGRAGVCGCGGARWRDRTLTSAVMQPRTHPSDTPASLRYSRSTSFEDHGRSPARSGSCVSRAISDKHACLKASKLPW